MTLSRRTFLGHGALATMLAGVPSWARAAADQSVKLASQNPAQGIVNFAITPEPPVLVSFANTSGTSVTVSSKVLEGLTWTSPGKQVFSV
ncbi:hypothetical protein VRY85_12100 [Achromobacter sp. F4_2707]|uniref:hypothetical protein n=1 Tax=Achromobacter sp. F4_2707 TaxID=3114286 RepID=UPI0039C5F4DB